MLKEKLSDKRGFARNFLALSSSSFLLHFVNFFTNMYLARTLGPNGFGFYGVIITWSSILLAVAGLGVDQVTTRAVARNQNDSLFHFKQALLIRLAGLVLTSLSFIIYCFYTKDLSFLIVVLVIINTLLSTIWNNIQSVAFGMRRMESTGYINVIGSVVLLLVYFILPSYLVSAFVVYLISVVVLILKDVALFLRSKREGLFGGGTSKPINLVQIKEMILECLPFYILVLFALVTNQFPVLFLSENAGNVEVAYFNTANKLLIPLSVILSTMFQAIFPILVEEKEHNPIKFYQNAKRLLFLIVSLGVICCLTVSLARDEIVVLVYGEEYQKTGVVLLTQCWYIVYFAVLSHFGTMYIVLGRDKLLAALSILNAIVWAPFLWFTSKYGAISISYGFVIGGIINLITNSVALFFVDKKLIPIASIVRLNIFLLIGLAFSLLIPAGIGTAFKFVIFAVLVLITYPLYQKFRKISFEYE